MPTQKIGSRSRGSSRKSVGSKKGVKKSSGRMGGGRGRSSNLH